MVYVDITVRVASDEPRIFQMGFMDGPTIEQNQRFSSPGLGSQTFQDIIWSGVELVTSKPFHVLSVEFLQYGISICSVSVSYSTKLPVSSVPIPPFTWSAVDYDDALDLTQPENLGDGCGGRLDGVDTVQTHDEICNQRDNSFCAINNTSIGEFLEYKFHVLESETGVYSIRVRVSAFEENTTICLDIWSRADVSSPYENTFDIPFSGKNLGSYHDLVWTPTSPLKSGEYVLTVNLSKNLYFCSVSVLDSQALPPPTIAPRLRSTASPSLRLVPTKAPIPQPTSPSSLRPVINPTEAPQL
jgi:hypothetical protein